MRFWRNELTEIVIFCKVTHKNINNLWITQQKIYTWTIWNCGKTYILRFIMCKSAWFVCILSFKGRISGLIFIRNPLTEKIGCNIIWNCGELDRINTKSPGERISDAIFEYDDDGIWIGSSLCARPCKYPWEWISGIVTDKIDTEVWSEEDQTGTKQEEQPWRVIWPAHQRLKENGM